MRPKLHVIATTINHQTDREYRHYHGAYELPSKWNQSTERDCRHFVSKLVRTRSLALAIHCKKKYAPPTQNVPENSLKLIKLYYKYFSTKNTVERSIIFI